MTKKEKVTDIQVEVPLTKENRVKYSKEFMDAFDLISEAESDIKEYSKQRREDAAEFEGKIIAIRDKIKNSNNLSDDERANLASEVIEAMNHISEIDDDIKSYKAQKQYEIAKCEATMNIIKIILTRGKDIQWVKAKVFKDYAAKVKTFFDIETGEAIKTVPLTEDDMQLEMEAE
jgi:gas vesicle protein